MDRPSFAEITRRVRMFGPELSQAARFVKELTGADGRVPICWDEGPEVVVKCAGPEVTRRICDYFGDAVYSIDGRGLVEVVASLLVSAGRRVATAESCTGGMAGQLLTSIDGSSRYFNGGFVTYSNRAKIDLLDVEEETVDAYGAVSEEVAGPMAAGARKKLNADVGVSVTGIAGPSGGSDEKPVGMVCFGLADHKQIMTNTARFKGDRDEVRAASACFVLNLLRRWALQDDG